MNVSRHNSDLTLTRGNDAGTIWADQARFFLLQNYLHPHHVHHRNALIPRRHPQAPRSRLQRTDQAQRSSLRCNPSADVPRRRIEYRDFSLEDLASFSRGYAGNDLGSIFHAATGMKRARTASDTLDQESGLIID
jgi:hypothetical protein